jgi:cytochrome P450
MELPPWLPFLAVVLVLFLATIFRGGGHRAYRLPPGPKPWPIIGNLNLIGALPHRSIHTLSKRYGPLMYLRFGSVPIIIGSSAEIAKFFLKTQDIVFLDRPKTAASKYNTYNHSGMAWSPYGAYWRQARKMCLTELFSAKRLKSSEYIRAEEMRALLRDLHEASGRVVVLKDYLSTMSFNVITRMVLGKKYLHKDATNERDSGMTLEECKWMIDEWFMLNGVLNIGDAIPWLNWMDLQGYIKRMKKLNKMFDGFLEHVVEEHDGRRRLERESFVAKDMVDVLLEVASDPNLEVPIHRDGIKAFIQVRPVRVCNLVVASCNLI